MGTVPQAYYDFIIKYAPYFYVIATALASDAAADQKNVTVTDGSKFQAGYTAEIKDDAHSEWNEVDSVAGNVVTMKNNLAYTYYVSKSGKVEGPDPAFGKGAFPAAFAIDFLYEAYSASQFSSKQVEILAKIVSLADFLLTQQCTDSSRRAYGGFKSSETSTQYWSVDAGRCIPSLLKAYALAATAGYLNAPKLAGNTFLYTMQHKPSEHGLGLVLSLPFNEGSGTLASDKSGYDNDGTVYGASWVDGKYGKALSFDGIDDSLTVNDASSLRLPEFTICFWFKHDGTGGDYERYVGRGVPVNYWIYYTSSSHNLAFEVHENPEAWHGISTNVLSYMDNNWHFFVGRFKKGTIFDIWLDGVQKTSQVPNWDASLASGNLISDAKGGRDEVRVYNRALTAEEIMDHYLHGSLSHGDDKYYGGFAKYVDINNELSQEMQVEDLYDFIGLKLLADTYDIANKTTYETMMSDAVAFLRSGFEDLYLYFDPKPSGDGKWHRVGLTETQVYDDPVSFALLGLYTYEGWSLTCRRVYNFVQSIRASAEYPAYNPAICWPGYIDVVTRFPACNYYDNITSGILWRIRAAHDKSCFQFAMQIINEHQDEFMYWGTLFTDYSPATTQKAMANNSWLGLFFLNYSDPVTPFTRILRKHGENVLLFSIIQAAETVSYASAVDVQAIVSPARVEGILPEAGYILTDYVVLHVFAPVRHHDKIRRKGVDYEVTELQEFDFQGDTLDRRAVCRRLLGQ